MKRLAAVVLAAALAALALAPAVPAAARPDPRPIPIAAPALPPAPFATCSLAALRDAERAVKRARALADRLTRHARHLRLMSPRTGYHGRAVTGSAPSSR